jgi:CSLREA domain-containing protein
MRAPVRPSGWRLYHINFSKLIETTTASWGNNVVCRMAPGDASPPLGASPGARARGARHRLPASATTFAVTTTQDAPNVSPSGTTCQSTLPGNPCTLRAAVQAANALGGTQTINLTLAGTYLLTVTGANEDNAASGDLDVNGVNLTIANVSGGLVAIDGNGTDRVFDIGPLIAAQVAMSSLTVQNGNAGVGATNGGGAVQTGTESTLDMSDTFLMDNSAGGGAPPGSRPREGSGGALYNAGRANLRQVVVTGNMLQNVTVTDNVAEPRAHPGMGGGIFNTIRGRLQVMSSIINGSVQGGNCSGTISSQGDNISSDGTCNFTGQGDRNNTDPLLGPLQDNGGFTPTHALLPGSPAIDAVSHNPCPPPATDQRGFLRPAGPRCDVGAFELGAASPTPTPTATSTSTNTPTRTATPTSTLTPTSTATAIPTSTLPATPTPTPTSLTAAQAIAQVAPSGQPGMPCADTPGQACQAAGAVHGAGTVAASMTWSLQATVTAGTVPVAVFSTTAGLQGFPCAPVTVGAAAVNCVGVTAGNALQGSVVTVVFGPGVTTVGTVTGPGPRAKLGTLSGLGATPLPPPPPILLPPPPPPLVPLPTAPFSGTPRGAPPPEIPVVPEADSLLLIGASLAALAGLAALRRRRGR